MLTCLADLRTVSAISDIPQALSEQLSADSSHRVAETLSLGEQIARATELERDAGSLTTSLVELMSNGRE